MFLLLYDEHIHSASLEMKEQMRQTIPMEVLCKYKREETVSMNEEMNTGGFTQHNRKAGLLSTQPCLY